MKSIMYHYVREFDSLYPNFRFLDIANFRRQLDFFERTYGFVDRTEWSTFTKKGELPNIKGKVLLTFDDAMKCHFDYVYPELVNRGLWAIFYIPLQPYLHNKILDVHRIHLLCGAFNGMELYNEAKKCVYYDMIQDSKREEFRNKTYLDQSNLKGVSELKRLLNYFIDYKYRDHILDNLSKHFGCTFDPSDFYVNKNQLKQMYDGGMVIGSHTVTHPVMSKLSATDQIEEISTSFAGLNKFGIISEKTYCHPYGGFHTFDANTISALEREGVSYSFNVEPREIETVDFYHSRQFLPRFDCNLFEYGQAS
jgi:peptidoglycan/xylan/chitin deacetylase (PgdA/CDA1 family)